MALPSGSENHWSVRKLLSECPPKYSSGGARHEQATSRLSKSLNLSPSYASHFNSGIRELIQNWHDQCKVVAEGAVQTLDYTSAAAAARGEVLLACVLPSGVPPPAPQHTCCGYLALCQSGEGLYDVYLHNFATSIGLATMTMGLSSKRDQSLAGFFGEGVKVEINRIVSSGANVTYLTSNCEWRFAYEEEHGTKVLHLHSARLPSTSDSSVAIVRGAKKEWFKRENYLFLDPLGYTCWRADSSSPLEVLPGAEHVGRVYVHGFFVAEERTLPLVGLNYVGAGDTLESVGIGRDRNSVQIRQLVYLIPELVEGLEGKPGQQALVSVLCAALENHPRSAWRCLTYLSDDAYRVMADRMYEEFRRLTAPGSVPTSASNPNPDAAYLGLRCVMLSDELYDVLKDSRHHLSSDQLWERHNAALLNHPAYVFNKADQVDCYRWALINDLFKHFPKYLLQSNVLFKALPPGNTHIVLALAIPSSTSGGKSVVDARFVVDLTALDLRAVHAAQLKEDSLFQCTGECVCLSIALKDAALAAIAKAHGVPESRLRRELDHAMFRQHGPRWAGGSNMPPPQQPAPGAGVAAVPDAAQQPPSTPAQPGRASRSGSAAGQPTPDTSHASTSTGAGNWDQQDSGSGQGQDSGSGSSGGDGGGSGSRGEPAPGGSPVDDSTLEGGVLASLMSGSGQRGRAVGQVQDLPAPAEQPGPAEDCRSSSEQLARSRICIGAADTWEGGRMLFLRTLPDGSIDASQEVTLLHREQLACLRGLHCLLSRIHAQVFLGAARAAEAPRFYVFYDKNDRCIAFNCGRECWYNAAYDMQDAPAPLWAQHWYLVACHELAHNFVSNHCSQFAQVNSQLCLKYSRAFWREFPHGQQGGGTENHMCTTP